MSNNLYSIRIYTVYVDIRFQVAVYVALQSKDIHGYKIPSSHPVTSLESP